jgi:hypothetical protein
MLLRDQFLKYISKYKKDLYLTKSINLKLDICLLSLKAFAVRNSLELIKTIKSFVDFTFCDKKIRISNLPSYLNQFYDNYSNHGLFELIELTVVDEKSFSIFVLAYKSWLEKFYHSTVEIDKIEILKQAFVNIKDKVSEEEYNNFIQAQFEGLEWTGKVVTPYHLKTEKALLRYIEWKKKNVGKMERSSEWYDKALKK